MRRLIIGSTAFLAMAGTVLVLPVYAAPAPSAEPVATSSDVVPMGSVDDPAPAAAVQEGTSEAVEGVPQAAPTLTVSEAGTRFALVGVTWAHDPAVTDTVVQVRARDADGAWGDWTEVEIDLSGQDVGTDSGAVRRGGTEPLWTGPSTAIEAELVTRSGAQPTDVTLNLIDPGTSPADRVMESPEITDTANAAGTMPPVFSRAQWGADESIRTWEPEYPATLKASALHHTAGSNGYSEDQVPGIIRAIYSYHTVTRGWGDIGYNVLVDRFGRIWEGRHGGLASTVIGAHSGGFNTSTFGVSMLGNYDTVAPSAGMVESVAEIIAWKFSLYGIDPGGSTALTSAGSTRHKAGTEVTLPTIFGHRDVSLTSCPGDYGYAKMDTVRNLVAAKLPAYSNPRGHLDSVAVGSEAVSLSGWAFDPNVPETALGVHVHVDGRPVRALAAGERRPDIGAAFPVAGPLHGFRVVVPVTAGTRQVCAFGINQGMGSHQNLGCRTVVVRAAQAAPRGAFDSATVFGSEALVRGWALDDDQPTTALAVHLYVNGKGAGTATAGQARPDVAGAFPGASPARGFSAVLRLGSGSNRVCAYAINVGAGSDNPLLGCRTVTVGTASHSPVGALSGATVSGRMVTLDGWSVDPDALTGSTQVHLYVDGRGAAAVAANTAVAAATTAGYAPFGAGTAYGFRSAIAIDAGRHRVCAYGINVGIGTNALLGCRDVTIAASAWNPVGGIDGAVVDRRYVDVRGWALDFDRAQYPIGVHLYLNGKAVKGLLAADPHAGAAALHPGTGDSHGYLTRITAPAGTNSACVYGINVGQGTGNPLLGCTTFTVAESAYNPEGALDDATVTDGVLTVRGWTYDPDVPTSSIDAHVYVDGVGRAVRADEERLDVALANDGVGAYHGYRLSVALAPGSHTVCAYAINVGTGTDNTTLGCRTVTV